MTLTVFYIDDEAALCENFQDEFDSPEIIVQAFIDPNEALQAAANRRPDLLFIDYRLPNTNGDQVAQAFTASIPKILVTGDLHIKSRPGFVEVLHKPTSFERIAEIIDHYAKIKQAAS